MVRGLLVAALGCMVAWGLTPAEVVVVYNASSTRSKQCAEAYCARRSIPSRQCIGLTGLSTAQDISRLDFDTKVRYALLQKAQDIRASFLSHIHNPGKFSVGMWMQTHPDG